MTDQTLDEQVRPIVAAMRAAMRRDAHAYPEAKFLSDMSGYIKDLEALLPARPTLADMTPEERAACQWMQADTNGGRDVISNPCYDQGRATILLRDGTSIPVSLDRITPRPDLPRMEWPRDTGIPGVAVGVPVTDPQVMMGISIDAPDGTVVVGHTADYHPTATVKSGSTWQSTAGMRAHLYHALGAPDYSELESVTVVRWGKETDQ